MSSNIAYKLYFYENNKLFKKVAIEINNYNNWIVGKGPESHIRLNNPRISKNHIQIIYNRNGDLLLQDLNSTNGTYLNGIKISNVHKLKEKDRLQLAGVNDILIVVEKSSSLDHSTSQNNLQEILSKKDTIIIGRDKNCDIVLPEVTVSSKHAEISKISDEVYLLRDLGSTNGTYINGDKLRGSVNISLSDKIYIGRHLLSLESNVVDLNEQLAISAVGVEKTYPNGTKALKKMDLSIPSKSVVAIMGPSGCGKSTLLKALNGDNLPSKGKVFLFNQEISSNWQYLKTQIGYVPQDDIVHKQLTVEECLYFTAKLRLDNLKDKEINNKIDKVLKELNILDKKFDLINDLSGGQKKRISIAMELMTDPLILFLDEPTSPLDPQTVDDFLGIIKKLSEKGTTVIMVTHKPEDLQYMDEVIFMAEGGYIVYQGDTTKYKDYFNVGTAVAVFSEISGKSSKIWIERFRNPRPLSKSSEIDYVKKNEKVSNIRQFYWLTRRYFRIKINDKMNSLLMLGQAPIIAVLICLIFDKVTPVVLFMITVSAIWLGTQNAVREIVSENPIYKRERMFNLHIFPYLYSKITVLSFFSILQSIIFLSIITLKFSGNTLAINNPIIMFLWMIFISITSTFLGLLLSSVVKNSERAMTILPLILLPQIMLAGIIAKVNNCFVEFISYFTISRWGVEGFSIIQDRVINEYGVSVNALESIRYKFHESYYNEEIFGDLTGTIELDSFAIIVMVIIMNVSIYKFLKDKDSITKYIYERKTGF